MAVRHSSVSLLFSSDILLWTRLYTHTSTFQSKTTTPLPPEWPSSLLSELAPGSQQSLLAQASRMVVSVRPTVIVAAVRFLSLPHILMVVYYSWFSLAM